MGGYSIPDGEMGNSHFIDIDSNFEARKEYNKKETQRQNQQSQEFRRSCRTRIIMNVVSKFKDKDRYYIPWSFVLAKKSFNEDCNCPLFSLG